MSWENRKLTVSRLRTENNDEYVLAIEVGKEKLHHSFPRLPMQVILTDFKVCYTGTITRDDIEKAMAGLKVSSQSYYQNTTEALLKINESGNTNNYAYEVQKVDAKQVKFVWKIFLDADNVKYQLGNVIMYRGQPENVMRKLMMGVIDQLSESNSKVIQLETERDELSLNLNDALVTLTTCVEEKNQLETSMYAKFVAVVNEKKARIATLEKAARQDGNSNKSLGSGKTPSPQKAGPSSASKGHDLSFFYSTDDDEDVVVSVTLKNSQKRDQKRSQESEPKVEPKPTPVKRPKRNSKNEDSDPSNLLNDM